MSIGDILPLVTGGGGAIVVLVLGYWLILSGHFVRKQEHQAALDRAVKLEGTIEKLERANDLQRQSIADLQHQNTRLLDNSGITNQLVSTLFALARERGGNPSPSQGSV